MGIVKVLLDTCCFLWLARSPERISSAATEVINDSSNPLYLSDVSVWEIVLKHAAGVLPLPEPPRTWVARQTEFFQLLRAPVDLESLFRSGELPRHHRDPFDRLLAAQAVIHRLTLLSPDQPLSELGAERCW